MADTPRDEEAAPKSSADLIRQAREALGGNTADEVRASEDLMESARDWLGSGAPATGYEMPPEPGDGPPDPTAAGRDEPTVEATFEPQPWSPAPSRRRAPASLPPVPAGYQDSGRQTRLALWFAVVVGLVALGGVAAALLVASNQDVPATVSPVTVSSTGSITSGSDPCTGATISGDLQTVITYWPDPEAPQVMIDIVGSSLSGSDGTGYVLIVAGSMEGAAGQETFVFPSDSMTMTRSDGVVIEDEATITITIVDGNPDDWSYSSTGGECPG